MIITQDLFVYEITGEDAQGNLIGNHRTTGIGRPRFWERARYYGEEKRLAAALDAAEVATEAANPPAPIAEPTARAMVVAALNAEAQSPNASVRSTAQLVQGLAGIVLGPTDPNG